MSHLLPHAIRGVFGCASVLFVLGAPAELAAQTARAPLTLADVVQRLERSNPMIAAARASADAAVARVGPVRALPDPRAELAVMNRMLPRLSTMSPLAMDQLTITQMLPLATRRAATQAAEARAQAAGRGIGVQRALARRDAALMLADWWQADAARTVMDETRGLLTESVAVAEAMYRAGQAKQTEVLRLQADLTRMTAEWTAMDGMRRSAAAALGAMLDAPLDADALRVELPVAVPEAAARTTMDASANRGDAAEVIAAHDRVAAAHAEETVAQRERWPELEVGLQLGSRPNTTERMVGVMAGASIPIFAASRQRKMAEEATAMRRMAEAESRAADATARAGAEEARAALDRSRALQRLYDGTLLPQLNAARESANAAYRAGTGSVDMVLDAVMAVNAARLARVTVQADETRAMARLEYFTGRAWFAVPMLLERAP
jgi:outer membrane protein, heavy metal efflux system